MVNFEMIGVPMTSTYKAYLTGFKKSNMAQKINEYAGKELVGFYLRLKNISFLNDLIIIRFSRNLNYLLKPFQPLILPIMNIIIM